MGEECKTIIMHCRGPGVMITTTKNEKKLLEKDMSIIVEILKKSIKTTIEAVNKVANDQIKNEDLNNYLDKKYNIYATEIYETLLGTSNMTTLLYVSGFIIGLSIIGFFFYKQFISSKKISKQLKNND